MAVHTLRELFTDQLRDAYDAEHRLTRALPKMAKAATSEELRAAFEDHLKQTEEHVSRLEQVLESMDEPTKRKPCKAIVGLLEEGEELMNEDDENVRDAALIAAAQKVEHYEMATYGCLRTWADLLGEDEASRLLQTTLNEEGAADHKLSEIAESLNLDAMENDRIAESGDGEDETADVPASRTNGGRANPRPRYR
jgi:ferritin-like metal-binding protein YciE